jgi:hypothetical protein
MKSTVSLILVFFLLMFSISLFAFTEKPNEKFEVNKNFTKKTTITWNGIEKNINEFCQKESVKRGLGGFQYPVDACSFWDQDILGNDVCAIYTKKLASQVTLGHEVRHCFQGSWHK